ncbi:PAS domain-containing protein [Bradyrhizobium cenepequi]
MYRFILQQNIAHWTALLGEEMDEPMCHTIQWQLLSTQRDLAFLTAASEGISCPIWNDSTHLHEFLKRFRRQFENSPACYLLLDPRAGLHIVDVNDTYAKATMTAAPKITGQRLFDVFPDNPDDPSAAGVANVFSSLRTAAESGRPHAIAVQRYDIRDPDSRFVKRFWRSVNTPVIKDGRLVYLLHQIEDVTAQFPAQGHIFVDDESENLIGTAFEKSWRFVDKDPFLAHNPKPLLRDRLRVHLELSLRNGERDLFHLANNAISNLRTELGRCSRL